MSDYYRHSGKEVFLEISSFIGYLGKHYYGKIECWNKKDDKFEIIELTRRVTQEEIDKDPEDWFRYDVGDNTNRFNSQKEVIKKARRVWKKHFPHALVLVLGRVAVCEPQKVLSGPKEYKEEMNKLFKKISKIPRRTIEEYYNNVKKFKAIEDEFDSLRESLQIMEKNNES